MPSLTKWQVILIFFLPGEEKKMTELLSFSAPLFFEIHIYNKWMLMMRFPVTK